MVIIHSCQPEVTCRSFVNSKSNQLNNNDNNADFGIGDGGAIGCFEARRANSAFKVQTGNVWLS